MKALMVRRCRCGEPLHDGYRHCGDPRCFEATYLLNPMRPNIPEPHDSAKTSHAWIEDHCHEWEARA